MAAKRRERKTNFEIVPLLFFVHEIREQPAVKGNFKKAWKRKREYWMIIRRV